MNVYFLKKIISMEISWSFTVDSTAVNEKRNLCTASNSRGKKVVGGSELITHICSKMTLNASFIL